MAGEAANFPSLLTILWGTSSALTQVIVAPTGTVVLGGRKLKLSILMVVAVADAIGSVVAAGTARGATDPAAAAAAPAPAPAGLLSSGESTTASAWCPRRNSTLAIPSTLRSWLASTFNGPGEGAVPGAGCGNAVDIAVWNRTFPSTFCSTWWMWPFSTLTDPNRLRSPSACSLSSVPHPHSG